MPQPKGPKIVVIGGGTGTFTVLSSLKYYAKDITAIMNMVDDGGSTGVLRDELGALPPGDIRQSLVALASASEDLRNLFNYRFHGGAFGGHAFGNLFISALEQMTGSITGAVRVASEVLSIQGKVIPATTDNVRLMLKTPDGRLIKGEDKIGEGPADDPLFIKGKSHHLYLEPSASLNPDAAVAIAAADIVVIAPGKLYSSVVPSFLLKGMPEALSATRAKIVYVCNLMTRPNQTAGFKVTDFASEIERYAGGPILNYVIYNTQRPSKSLLDRYALEGEREPVEYDRAELAKQHYIGVGEPLISRKAVKKNSNDKWPGMRTLIRHDSDRLARLIMRIYFS
jgi:uncharacterized cofD-like protein